MPWRHLSTSLEVAGRPAGKANEAQRPRAALVRDKFMFNGGAFMAKHPITRTLALSAILALLASACVDNRPRNGAGEPVDRTTGTTAPGAATSR